MSKKLFSITLPEAKPTFMPVTKANQRMKSKKDYKRNAKHKKPLF